MTTFARWSVLGFLAFAAAGCCKLAFVIIRPGPELSRRDASFQLRHGTDATLVAEARGDAPCVLYSSTDSPSAFRWVSSDTMVVTVSAQGIIHGVNPGDATIRVTSKGYQATAPISVVLQDSTVVVRVAVAAVAERVCG